MKLYFLKFWLQSPKSSFQARRRLRHPGEKGRAVKNGAGSRVRAGKEMDPTSLGSACRGSNPLAVDLVFRFLLHCNSNLHCHWIGACAMTTKFLDNKIFTFEILLLWRFPWKIAFWKIVLPAPLPTPPWKVQILFLLSSRFLWLKTKPPLEPMTVRLRSACSANWKKTRK